MLGAAAQGALGRREQRPLGAPVALASRPNVRERRDVLDHVVWSELWLG